jgi:hypothetical protein
METRVGRGVISNLFAMRAYRYNTGQMMAGRQYLKYYGQMIRSWGSSVSIVSGYGRDDRAIGVRSQTEARDSSSKLSVQTVSGVLSNGHRG